MKASKLTARGLAYVVRAVGRKIAKAHRARQTPHGKQTVKKLMAHGTSTSSLELSGDTKLFDRGRKSSKCNKNLARSFPTEALSRAVVQKVNDDVQLRLRQRAKIIALGKEKP